MNIYEQALKAMRELRGETKEMGTGVMPNPLKVLEIQGELCEIHMELATKRSLNFDSWQHAELKRREAIAKNFKAQRSKSSNPSAKDAEMAAFVLSMDEYQTEKDEESAFKKMLAFSASVEHAIDYARSVQSFIKKVEQQYGNQ
jgi:hypothetical protein